MHLRGLLFIALCLGFTACGNGERIPEGDFIDILEDIYLSKAYFTTGGQAVRMWNDSVTYDQHIVEQHGYSWAQFDSTLSWFSARPKEFQEIYDEVIARMNVLEASIQSEADPPEELWHGNSRYAFHITKRGDTIPVNVMLRKPGRYIISAKIRLAPTDASIDPQIALYWWRSDSTGTLRDTFLHRSLPKDGLMYSYSTELHSPDSAFTHLKGSILYYRPNPADSSRRAEVCDISVYLIPDKPLIEGSKMLNKK